MYSITELRRTITLRRTMDGTGRMRINYISDLCTQHTTVHAHVQHDTVCSQTLFLASFAKAATFAADLVMAELGVPFLVLGCP